MIQEVAQIEYNTERPKLIIPEYGRHIQKMVDHAIATEDKNERNKIAKGIIAVMGNLNPHLRDVPDFQPMLWDQLFIISDFKLDVDSPYPKPSRDELMERPEPLKYPQNHPKYRFYGNNIKRMIDVASQWEEGDKKEGLILTIANHMKKCFLNWNKDTVEDDVIFDHLFELSEGRINLKNSQEDLSDASNLLKNKKRYSSNSSNKKNYKSNSNRNRKRY
ncbi:MAG: methionyl-tRNA formyltransferase [Aequorivita sp.]|nr:methionyl-tRNA formyltransferase [Aequorivita sp.]